ncbi:MAG: M28 family peptidase [Bacteroidia bacterium]|nr:M28 family peptidase [Bacteroidia bacterium]MDW8236747.1 M28 family peptidase [Bacteroidia bacterium]
MPSLEERIRILCADSLEGRRAGTVSERITVRLVAEWMTSAIQRPPIIDTFAFMDEDSLWRKSYNVYGILPGEVDSFIVLIAHYDHLGWGGIRSRSIGRHSVHPGADDNASGVSLIIEIAASLARNLRRNSYLFALISAHEPGLWGSQQAAKFLREKRYDKKTLAVVVLDMVGRMSPESSKLYIYHPPSHNIPCTMRSTSRQTLYSLTPKLEESDLRFSDCFAFVEMGLPCFLITTGYHDDYHRISDTPDKLNYEGIYRVFDYLRACYLE